MNKIALGLILLTLVVAVGCVTPPNQGVSSTTLSGPVTFTNSGSTNFAGWVIQVNPDGSGTLSPSGTGGSNGPITPKSYPAGTFNTTALAQALSQAWPLSQVAPATQCGKSISFGTTLTVSYNGQASTDLSCGNGNYAANAQALVAYAVQVSP